MRGGDQIASSGFPLCFIMLIPDLTCILRFSGGRGLKKIELNFPAVTICSLSFLNTTTLESTDAGKNVTSKLMDLFDEVRSNSNTPGCQSIARELSDNTGYNT